MSNQDQDDLFGPRPPQPPKKPRGQIKPIEFHIWTQQKAALISEYLHRFLLVTKNGIYLDLFAGPQAEAYNDDWSVKQVIERRTTGPSFSKYLVCDLGTKQLEFLRQLRDEHKGSGAMFRVYAGDANELIEKMLRDANIGPRSACFCLIDQRAFECHWKTVETIARFKSGYKIEQFYFLASKWLPRAKGGTKDHDRLERWWGRPDYEEFFHLQSVAQAHTVCSRFREEFSYEYVDPWSIHKEEHGGETMYYMIHATDHPRARALMSDAYTAVKESRSKTGVQTPMFPNLIDED